MNKQELTDIFVTRIEEERIKRNWKQHEIAQKIDMSVSGYRKMISGKTDTVSLYTAYKASVLFDIPMVSLCTGSVRMGLINKIQTMPESVCNRIDYYLECESKILNSYQELDVQSKYVDVLIPTGFMRDGMQVNSYTVDKILIKDIYDEEIHKGLLVSENSYVPAYAKGDVLLINETMARNGDIVLLLYAPTRRFYIRKLVIRDDYFECRPVSGRGDNFIITQEERKQWIDVGHVVAVLHR